MAGESLEEVVGLGVREGIRSARRLLTEGFGTAPAPQGYPTDELFPPHKEKPEITEFNLHIPPEKLAQAETMETWSILTKTSKDQEEYLAGKYLQEGLAWT